MGVDRIGEVGDRSNEGQAAGVYGAGFTVGSMARVGTRGGTRGPGIKVSSDIRINLDPQPSCPTSDSGEAL